MGRADLDRFIAMRRSGELRPKDNRKHRGVRDGTIGADISWLSTVLRWARGYRVDGRPLVAVNPLEGFKRPKEMNILRPIASHDRYLSTLAVADQVDPGGRLRCMLALARWTGHRESAICQLRVSDFLRGEVDVRRVLAGLGQDESRSKHFPRGGLRWRAESDKQGYAAVVPISDHARAELDRYLERNPRLGDVPLFPAHNNPEKPIRRDVAGLWLLKAEKLANVPKLRGGRWHPYRRLWATERKHLPVQDVAAAGGWGDTQALATLYQKADPATVLQVVEVG